MKRALIAALLVAVALAAAPARAQVVGEQPPPPFPDPAKFSRGLFAEGDIGAVVFLGKMGHYADPGADFAVRVGYDVLRWLAVYGKLGGATFGSSAPPPYDQQVQQLFAYTAEARAQLQLRRWGLWASGGVGMAHLTNNLLELVGVTGGHRFTAAVGAGVGVDFHTLNRHFSVGVAVDYLWLAQFDDSHAVTMALYLRYTR